ncbi:MAG: hypothetical protein ACE5LU_18115 [Anaerolineae bacterium]
MSTAYTIHEIENCSSLEEAVQRLMRELGESRAVYRQVHRLGPHQGFPVHRHFTTNEWTVVYDAEFDFVTRKESVHLQSPNKATVIHIPIGVCHTVRSRASALRYAVVKDGPDDFNLC